MSYRRILPYKNVEEVYKNLTRESKNWDGRNEKTEIAAEWLFLPPSFFNERTSFHRKYSRLCFAQIRFVFQKHGKNFEQ